MRVLVVGAGVLGASTALHLARRGDRVRVVDARGPGGGTTRLGAGIFSVGLMHADDVALVRASLKGMQPLLSGTPGELEGPGSFHLADASGASALAAIARSLTAAGIEHGLLTGAEWEQAHAGLGADATGVKSVLATPGDRITRAEEVAPALMSAAVAAGVRANLGTSVSRLVVGRNGVRGVQTQEGSLLSAERVVVAAGAWSRGLLERSGLRLPALGYRTHAAVFGSAASGVPILHDTLGGFYVRPYGLGRVLIGDGTRLEATDPIGFSEEAEAGFVEDVADRAGRRLRSLADASLQRSWRGVLTGVPDRRPLVGEHPDRTGLFLATGANGFGIMRGYALGALAAARVHGEVDALGLDAAIATRMDPARFWPNPPQDFPLRQGFVLDPS